MENVSNVQNMTQYRFKYPGTRLDYVFTFTILKTDEKKDLYYPDQTYPVSHAAPFIQIAFSSLIGGFKIHLTITMS